MAWAAFAASLREAERAAAPAAAAAAAASTASAVTSSGAVAAHVAPPPLLYLPGKLRVTDVPESVRRACVGCVTALAADAFGALAERASEGYCEETDGRDAGADCRAASKGMLQLGRDGGAGGGGRGDGRGAVVRLQTPEDCLRFLAAECPRARFASISVSERDCSWYAECELGALKQSGLGHKSFALTHELRRALGLTAGLTPPV